MTLFSRKPPTARDVLVHARELAARRQVAGDLRSDLAPGTLEAFRMMASEEIRESGYPDLVEQLAREDVRDEYGDVIGSRAVVAYPLYWRVRVIRPEWHGRRCRIVIHGGRGNRLIEFDNGDRVVCPGAYLRRAA